MKVVVISYRSYLLYANNKCPFNESVFKHVLSSIIFWFRRAFYRFLQIFLCFSTTNWQNEIESLWIRANGERNTYAMAFVEDIVRYISLYDFDIVLFQEIPSSAVFEALLTGLDGRTELKYFHYDRLYFFTHWNRTLSSSSRIQQSGLAVFSRWPIRNARFHPLDTTLNRSSFVNHYFLQFRQWLCRHFRFCRPKSELIYGPASLSAGFQHIIIDLENGRKAHIINVELSHQIFAQPNSESYIEEYLNALKLNMNRVVNCDKWTCNRNRMEQYSDRTVIRLCQAYEICRYLARCDDLQVDCCPELILVGGNFGRTLDEPKCPHRRLGCAPTIVEMVRTFQPGMECVFQFPTQLPCHSSNPLDMEDAEDNLIRPDSGSKKASNPLVKQLCSLFKPFRGEQLFAKYCHQRTGNGNANGNDADINLAYNMKANINSDSNGGLGKQSTKTIISNQKSCKSTGTLTQVAPGDSEETAKGSINSNRNNKIVNTNSNIDNKQRYCLSTSSTPTANATQRRSSMTQLNVEFLDSTLRFGCVRRLQKLTNHVTYELPRAVKLSRSIAIENNTLKNRTNNCVIKNPNQESDEANQENVLKIESHCGIPLHWIQPEATVRRRLDVLKSLKSILNVHQNELMLRYKKCVLWHYAYMLLLVIAEIATIHSNVWLIGIVILQYCLLFRYVANTGKRLQSILFNVDRIIDYIDQDSYLIKKNQESTNAITEYQCKTYLDFRENRVKISEDGFTITEIPSPESEAGPRSTISFEF